jgi:hypothetical protein
MTRSRPFKASVTPTAEISRKQAPEGGAETCEYTKVKKRPVFRLCDFRRKTRSLIVETQWSRFRPRKHAWSGTMNIYSHEGGGRTVLKTQTRRCIAGPAGARCREIVKMLCKQMNQKYSGFSGYPFSLPQADSVSERGSNRRLRSAKVRRPRNPSLSKVGTRNPSRSGPPQAGRLALPGHDGPNNTCTFHLVERQLRLRRLDRLRDQSSAFQATTPAGISSISVMLAAVVLRVQREVRVESSGVCACIRRMLPIAG